jgi:hypothetical protein
MSFQIRRQKNIDFIVDSIQVQLKDTLQKPYKRQEYQTLYLRED